nr:immunoglobulin light chain junction region [Macaca mulatta]MOX78094.1 immunoglobulin light chain junction region [Macaca mulatta]MOX79022.1 immunoglobulin light chain junction region [Macaca mulatta]MOX79451.1 immunoglobulin light chain junction region [Macaca mulatta]MOX79623.1 immunoglobulin light chain junction region [Macaca mulatta]
DYYCSSWDSTGTHVLF